MLISDLTPEMAESFGVEGQKGVLIDDVTKDGPAEKAGPVAVFRGSLSFAVLGGDLVHAKRKDNGFPSACIAAVL